MMPKAVKTSAYRLALAATALLIGSLYSASPAHSQRAPDRAHVSSSPPAADASIVVAHAPSGLAGGSRPEDPSIGAVVLGSTAGWAAGALAGAGAGYALARADAEFYALLGGMIGAPLGAAVGAHLGNQRRGNPLLSAVASFGAGVLLGTAVPSLAYRAASPSHGVYTVGIVFATNVSTAVLVERLTSP